MKVLGLGGNFLKLKDEMKPRYKIIIGDGDNTFLWMIMGTFMAF